MSITRQLNDAITWLSRRICQHSHILAVGKLSLRREIVAERAAFEGTATDGIYADDVSADEVAADEVAGDEVAGALMTRLLRQVIYLFIYLFI